MIFSIIIKTISHFIALINFIGFQYDTIVHKVKKTRCARQMQEIGENQEFNDDIEYFLDTLQVSCF